MNFKHTSLTLLAALAAIPAMSQNNTRKAEYGDAFFFEDEYKGDDFARSFVQSVKVLTPAHTSYVKGDTTVVFEAPGMTEVKVFCWKQPDNNDPWADGHDAALGEFKLAPGKERGEFVFKADAFPNGPTALRFHAKNDAGKQDYFELQLFNLGGVKWRQGFPKDDPPGAKGMKLVFADDFDALPAISPDGRDARYAAHKTGGGDFSGWQFADPAGDMKPYSHQGSYLRIHASKPEGANGRSGILSSLRADGTGLAVPIPAYFECRFDAHNAPGSWPAFWTLNKSTIGMDQNDPRFEEIKKLGNDEFDIIEAYGGYGVKNPNTRDGAYHCVSHFWAQDPQPEWVPQKNKDGSANPKWQPHSFLPLAAKLGEGSWWSWTPHTYGMALTETDVIYYFDNFEVGRHPMSPSTRAQLTWFLINYSVGGISGWQIDMERYGNKTDMWVDFVRVYCGSALPPEIKVEGFAGSKPARVTVSTQTPGAVIRYTLDGTDPTEQSPVAGKEILVDKPATVKASVFASGVKNSPPALAKVTAPPGAGGSVGVSFVTNAGDASQVMAPNDIGGIGADKQANWNSVAAGKATASGFVTADGSASPITLAIEGEAKPEIGEPWGFNGNDNKLKRGNLTSNPKLTFKGVPYEKYDVVVILGAGIHNVQGEVALTSAGGNNAFSFDYGWNGGKHEIAKTKPGEAAPCSNYVIFPGVTSPDFTVAMTWKGGKGWTGVAAVQIVPRK
ncbi:MAG: chitobiase/beta-hexosaminidase C-terminal domain-containing protein [Kiritimatiellaeota bacterium]|nr:chitobiase/beta-hexosaminidase C-terminal domain-containing protein [Kiritimatiellota bacterium]